MTVSSGGFCIGDILIFVLYYQSVNLLVSRLLNGLISQLFLLVVVYLFCSFLRLAVMWLVNYLLVRLAAKCRTSVR